MKTRVISGAVLVVLLAVTLLSGGYVTAGVLLFVSLTAYHELAGAFGFSMKDGKAGRMEIVGLLMVALHYFLMIMSKGDMKFFVLITIVLFCADAVVFVFGFPDISSDKMVQAVFSFVYAPMMLSFIYLIRMMPNGSFLAWIPFIAWVCDTCAYFAGSMFGKHKLCPKLSPKKTVEGAVGGVLGSVIVGLIFGYVFAVYAGSGISVSKSVISFGIITLIASPLSQIGDLIASGIKRNHDIKDYGHLIPGHGGIMDRFDSVIFITPVIYYLAAFLLAA